LRHKVATEFVRLKQQMSRTY